MGYGWKSSRFPQIALYLFDRPHITLRVDKGFLGQLNGSQRGVWSARCVRPSGSWRVDLFDQKEAPNSYRRKGDSVGMDRIYPNPNNRRGTRYPWSECHSREPGKLQCCRFWQLNSCKEPLTKTLWPVHARTKLYLFSLHVTQEPQCGQTLWTLTLHCGLTVGTTSRLSADM